MTRASDKILEEQERQRQARWEQRKRNRHRHRRRTASGTRTKRQRKPSLMAQIRRSEPYRSWCSLVLMAAGGRCLRCKATGKELWATHSTPMLETCKRYHVRTLREARLVDELWSPSKGVAMCWPCLYRKFILDAQRYGWNMERTIKWFPHVFPQNRPNGLEDKNEDNRLESLAEWQHAHKVVTSP